MGEMHCKCGVMLPKWAWVLSDGDEYRCERCGYAYSLGYLRDRAARRRAFYADNQIAGLTIEGNAELIEGRVVDTDGFVGVDRSEGAGRNSRPAA